MFPYIWRRTIRRRRRRSASGSGIDIVWDALSAFGYEGCANVMEYAAKKQQEAMAGAENNQDQASVANGDELQSDQKAGGGVSSSDLWTLSFTGEAQDETKMQHHS